MPEISVKLNECAYTVHVSPGVLARAGAIIASLNKSKKAAIVTDAHVAPLHLEALQQSLRSAGIEAIVATLQPGEDHKTLSALLPAFDTFLSARIDRATPVIALGGGMIGDMAGFVAGTLLRGVPFVQIPTTLLAMVDASVGGKTGVNHAVGKNLIGVFHQPIVVLADPLVLTSLPKRELVGGLAECIKHEIIRDADGFAALEQSMDRILEKHAEALTDLVAHNVQIKATVVEKDPFERGERAHLNFGHTFGHAIETVTRYAYSHGECVALGMVAASRMARDLRMINSESVERITRIIARSGLPISANDLDLKAVQSAMIFDKKVKGSRVRFILPDRIGHVVIRDDVPEDAVQSALETLIN